MRSHLPVCYKISPPLLCLRAGEWRAVNWKLFAKIFASWVITLPMAGTVAGLIFAFVAYAPSATFSPTAV